MPEGAAAARNTRARCGLVRARTALGYLAELFRSRGWYSADEVLRLHQRLVASAGGERERHKIAYVAVGLAATLLAFARKDL